jgi:hypothetical protein
VTPATVTAPPTTIDATGAKRGCDVTHGAGEIAACDDDRRADEGERDAEPLAPA